MDIRGNCSSRHEDDFFEASPFSAYAFVRFLEAEARSRGEDPSQLSTNNNPRLRLVRELFSWSRHGQGSHVSCSHLVVNCLALWRYIHGDLARERARKLLRWAIQRSESSTWPMFTQVPEVQMRFFREFGFREVASMTLDLNDYVPAGSSDMGTQRWVQMVYSPRSARSVSPSDRGSW